jgi:geranylgeranyl diphosphate synthase type II
MVDVKVEGTDAASRLARRARMVELALEPWLQAGPDVPRQLAEAMRYSLFSGGKRFRPALVLAACEVCGGAVERALPAAAAIECVHTFALIHDDLPVMDDDDLRRGQPTAHKVFGEAIALLAGDALLALAFGILSTQVRDAAVSSRLCAELAEAVGWEGMIGGQAADWLGQGEPVGQERVEHIHQRKTGRLIRCACRMGAVAAAADNTMMEALSRYGEHLGLAFQIVDDVLDATGSAAQTGKRTGKDLAAGKQTYPRAVGIEASRAAAQREAEAAIGALEAMGPQAEELRGLARLVVHRAG